jgi:hypothetical protein
LPASPPRNYKPPRLTKKHKDRFSQYPSIRANGWEEEQRDEPKVLYPTIDPTLHSSIPSTKHFKRRGGFSRERLLEEEDDQK